MNREMVILKITITPLATNKTKTMLLKAAFSILFPVLLFSASTGLECMIYVSSSDGINNTSCWTGGYQTPCATLDLALQGTTTVQDKCSSGTVINLSPGNYTLDTAILEQQLLRNNVNVSIIGMRNDNEYAYGEAKIACLNVSSSSYHWLRYIVFQCVSLYKCNNVPVSCTWPSFGYTTAHSALSQELCPVLNLNFKFINLPLPCTIYQPDLDCECDHLQFTVSITDTCTSKVYNWKNNLRVCLNNSICQHAKIISPRYCNGGDDDDPYNVYYELDEICFYSSNAPIEFPFSIQTLDAINVSTDTVTSVTTECLTNASTIDGQCYDNYTKYVTPSCRTEELVYLLPVDDYYYDIWYNDTNDDDNKCPFCIDECCYYEKTDQCYANCTPGSGIPINNLTCIQCKNYGLLMFFGIEILPITIIVLLILVFNIKLTNGFSNGVVFYSQMVAVAYSSYNFLSKWDANKIAKTFLTITPLSIFNLDFTSFLISHSLCITPYMSPLGVISFWYIVGLYPLILLLLIYVWIVLYDKGFRCVVFITRPFHRCVARFWNTTGIKQSLAHSIASVYLLCFSQLAATSIKVLSYDSDLFYYDAKIKYFHGVHGLAGFFAILVLLILIIIPTLYIQFYPFKWFRKLLDHLHLKKPLLISLGNAFTGPYKNGSNNTFDYRYFAGLYLLARIIILFQYINGMQYYAYAMPVTQACCCFLLAVMVIMLRPFQRNSCTFFELIFTTLLGGIGVTILTTKKKINAINTVVSIINCLIFGILIPGYVIYQIIKMAKACFHYHIRSPVTQPLVPNDEDWIADRMENPREYDEQHVTVRVDDHPEEQQTITIIATAATYGSTAATTN